MRAQSATEYVVILVVAVVVALVAIGILGGLDSKSTNERTVTTTLRSAQVGTESYSLGHNQSTLLLTNNQPRVIQVTGVEIGDVVCNSPDIPFTLRVGGQQQITCTNIEVTGPYNLGYKVNYTHVGSVATYQITLPNLVGDASTVGLGFVLYWTNLSQPGETIWNVAVDDSNNVYYGGTCETCASDDDAIAYMIVKMNEDGNLIWKTVMNASSFFLGEQQVTGLALDSLNNVYLTGVCYSCFSSEYDMYLAKVYENGTFAWQNLINKSVNEERVLAVATDQTNNVYITGYCDGCGNNGSTAIYTAKFDTDGNTQWENITDPSSTGDNGNGIAVDVLGNVYVTGSSCSGCGSSTRIYTMKFDTNGVHQWTNVTDPGSHDGGTSIALDANSNVYVAGSCDNCGYGVNNKAQYVIKFTSDGQHLWTNKSNPSASIDGWNAVSTDLAGNVYLTGDCYGCAVLGAIYTSKYTSSGAHVWTNVTTYLSASNGRDIAVDTVGSVIVTGTISSGSMIFKLNGQTGTQEQS